MKTRTAVILALALSAALFVTAALTGCGPVTPEQAGQLLTAAQRFDAAVFGVAQTRVDAIIDPGQKRVAQARLNTARSDADLALLLADIAVVTARPATQPAAPAK